MSDGIKSENESSIALQVSVEGGQTVVSLDGQTLDADRHIRNVVDVDTVTSCALLAPTSISDSSGNTYSVSGAVSDVHGDFSAAWKSDGQQLVLVVPVPSGDGDENKCHFTLAATPDDPRVATPRPTDPVLIVKKRGG